MQTKPAGKTRSKQTPVKLHAYSCRLAHKFQASRQAAYPFGQTFTGSYVWHCHILDHEDNEMMQKYEICIGMVKNLCGGYGFAAAAQLRSSEEP